MDLNTPGVTSSEPPTEEPTAGNVTPADDRPIQNVVAEFNRKYGNLQQKVDAVLNWIQTQAVTAQPQQPPTQPAELSDEDLWQRAQQGDRQAFELYQQRIADRRIYTASQQASYAQSVDRQLAAIMGKYPVLQDGTHPLTVHANTAYQLLLQRGYPAGRATLLEAAKTAITDRPDLVSELQGQGALQANRSRQTAAQAAQAGAMGVSHRMDSTPRSTKPLTDEQKKLARTMGVKDPDNSMKRFLQRQQEGKSQLTPLIAMAMEGEDQ